MNRSPKARVSVPSRGNGVIDITRSITTTACIGQFPSPLGEMGLSIGLLRAHGNLDGGFRPLSGKWGYRSYSPATWSDVQFDTGFRPLSGKWGYRSDWFRE